MEVVYEDNHIIIVNKQSGEIVQGDKTGDRPLSDIVKDYIKEKYQKPGAVFLGVVHRLDRPVSGLVVFARTSKALTRLNKMFAEGERIFTDRKTAYENISKRPIYDDEKHVVFKPLEELDDDETPQSVIFTVNAFELMLLLQLDGSHRSDNNWVMVPQASACQLIGCFVFEQSEKENPHMVLGPVDLASRKHMRHFIPLDYVFVAMPWKLFLKLEKISEKSLFQSSLLSDLRD